MNGIPDPGGVSGTFAALDNHPAITRNTFEGYDVRHVIKVEDGEPLFIGRDVCEVVGIAKYRDALAQLDDDERVSITVDTLGGPQKMAAVTEAGVWSLMLISRSPHVKPFKRWLTHDVIPAIRKTGTYSRFPAQPTTLPSKKELAQWVVEAEERAELAESRARELAVPASAWNELAEAAGDYSVADAAKVLSRDPNISTGERRLFKQMQGLGWVFRRDGHWSAYQNQVTIGRLVEKVNQPFVRNGESVAPAPTIRITPKGLQELHHRLGGGAAQMTLAVAE